MDLFSLFYRKILNIKIMKKNFIGIIVFIKIVYSVIIIYYI